MKMLLFNKNFDLRAIFYEILQNKICQIVAGWCFLQATSQMDENWMKVI